MKAEGRKFILKWEQILVYLFELAFILPPKSPNSGGLITNFSSVAPPSLGGQGG
jgi:hypothetical protein